MKRQKNILVVTPNVPQGVGQFRVSGFRLYPVRNAKVIHLFEQKERRVFE